MIRTLFVCLIVAVSSFVALAQEQKAWTDWSKKDAEKVLNDSSWGQTFTQLPPEQPSTQTVTNTRPGLSGRSNDESGAPTKSRSVHFRARLLSAKPVREAFARMVVLSQPNAGEELKAQLQGFVDRDFGDFLVIAFTAESENAQMAKGLEAMLTRLTPEQAKTMFSLERKDGKKAELIDYKAPAPDGMGGKIIFSKTLDGQPFLSGDDIAKLNVEGMKEKINFKFKASGMNYRGKLEY